MMRYLFEKKSNFNGVYFDKILQLFDNEKLPREMREINRVEVSRDEKLGREVTLVKIV